MMSNAEEKNPLMSVDQLARRWSMPRNNLYRWLRKGFLPCVKFGKRVFISRQTIVLYESGRQGRAEARVRRMANVT